MDEQNGLYTYNGIHPIGDAIQPSHSLLPFFTLAFSLSLVAQMVKRLPTMRETRVRSLDQEDPLAKEIATHSSIHTWKIPWTEEPEGLLQTQ